MSDITVDAALGGPYDEIGRVIAASGLEDASGVRRWVMQQLSKKNWDGLCKTLKIDRAEAERLRALCVAAWGEPEGSRS